jgi:hypothetical protein
MKTTELEQILALARKTQGWNFREHLPQRVPLTARCELIVIPPWLWQPRVRPLAADRYRGASVSPLRDAG